VQVGAQDLLGVDHGTHAVGPYIQIFAQVNLQHAESICVYAHVSTSGSKTPGCGIAPVPKLVQGKEVIIIYDFPPFPVGNWLVVGAPQGYASNFRPGILSIKDSGQAILFPFAVGYSFGIVAWLSLGPPCATSL
jgi:hypothetical protein